MLGWALAAIVIAIVAHRMTGDLQELRAQPLAIQPRWGWLLASGVLFLTAHAVLVQTWRATLGVWEARLGFVDAARIWSVSNLGKYLPGKVWQIGAMGAMARQSGVSPVAATGSAILGALVSVVAGFIVTLASGRALLERASGGRGELVLLLIALALVGLAAAPWIIPRLAPLAARITGRPLTGVLPARAVVISLLGTTMGWLIYGAAFQMLVVGVLGEATGGYAEYLAAYTISYLLGYLFLVAPAGLGVREGVMITALTYAGLASAPQASLIALVSRLWLTLLEVTPGVLFWAFAGSRRPPTLDTSDVPT